MKASSARRSVGAAILLSTALPAHLLAATFIVNSTNDPDTGNPANCSAPANPSICTLRDALAAADVSPDMDTVEFDVKDTIHLLKQLTVEHPVGINGGKGTGVRVHQEYEVVIQPDRFDDDGNGVLDDVPVLQPSYFSKRGTRRAMLELHGPGSSINNMVIDGSITPQPEDTGVARIDWESDGVTDNRLFTVEGEDKEDRWLVAGGILVEFAQLSPVNISDNELKFFSGNALQINSSVFSTVTRNVLSVGVFEGIQFSGGGILTVTNNRVTGFRDGLVIQFMSGWTVRQNDLIENRGRGIFVEGADDSAGNNLIEDNYVVGNANAGITIAAVGIATINGNTVDSNGIFGIDVKSADFGFGPLPSGGIGITNNDVTKNGTDPSIHGGIRIAEGSFLNSIIGNKVHANSGFGIVIDDANLNNVQDNNVSDSAGGGIILFHGSQFNNISANHVEKNGFGVLSVSDTGTFPSSNTIEGNALRNNSEADAADFFSTCENTWTNNKFRTALGPDGCID